MAVLSWKTKRNCEESAKKKLNLVQIILNYLIIWEIAENVYFLILPVKNWHAKSHGCNSFFFWSYRIKQVLNLNVSPLLQYFFKSSFFSNLLEIHGFFLFFRCYLISQSRCSVNNIIQEPLWIVREKL